MFIQTEPTPNPASLKFLPGKDVLPSGAKDFADADAAAVSPMAASLFGVEGVTGVFLGANFITVSKQDGADWAVLKPKVLAAIMEHYTEGRPMLSAELADDNAITEDDSEVVATIKELIETRVRPAVARDGGDIIYDNFEDGVVYLHMRGS
ncbi:MAG: NifU family protein, partial [Rhodospirillaceae bacterium]